MVDAKGRRKAAQKRCCPHLDVHVSLTSSPKKGGRRKQIEACNLPLPMGDEGQLVPSAVHAGRKKWTRAEVTATSDQTVSNKLMSRMECNDFLVSIDQIT